MRRCKLGDQNASGRLSQVLVRRLVTSAVVLLGCEVAAPRKLKPRAGTD